jgi:hypothetical protein
MAVIKRAQKEGRKVEDAALVFGGGVARQELWREIVLGTLAERGVSGWGSVEVVDDVVGNGVMGLVERAKERERKIAGN